MSPESLILIANWFSGPQLLIILALVMLLFGANRLPELMRSLGKSVTEFKKGINDGMSEDEEARKKIEKP